MKVLSIINISNTDDISCDSGIIFQRILADEFVKRGIKYEVVGPDIEAFKEFDFPQVEKHYINLGVTRYASRFGFDWSGFADTIQNVGPDLIFNNQVEITSSLRSLLVTLGSPETPIVSYCHYPALWGVPDKTPQFDQTLNHQELALPIVFNILSALVTGNTLITQSEFAKELIVKTANYFNIKSFSDVIVIPPPADPLLFEESLIHKPPNGKCILYNHRLYKSYGTGEFLEFIKSLNDPAIELIVSDPMPHRSSKRSLLNGSPSYYRKIFSDMPRARLVDGNVSRILYKDIIKDARVAFGAFRKACVWSMAVVDCMSLGIPVLAPCYGAYKEFVPLNLIFEDYAQAGELTDRLLKDDRFWMECSRACHQITHKLDPSVIAERFVEVFERVLSNRLSNTVR